MRVLTGRNLYCIDKNFGGVLIIWDRLFGKELTVARVRGSIPLGVMTLTLTRLGLGFPFVISNILIHIFSTNVLILSPFG